MKRSPHPNPLPMGEGGVQPSAGRRVRESGFTLIELLVVIAILAIIAAIGFNMDFADNRAKAESDIKQIYADMVYARQQALAQKRWVFMVFYPGTYSVYADTFPAPDGNKALDTALPPAGDSRLINGRPLNLMGCTVNINGAAIPGTGFQLNILPGGIINGSTGTITITTAGDASQQAQLDCISWSATSIEMGTWTMPAGPCTVN